MDRCCEEQVDAQRRQGVPVLPCHHRAGHHRHRVQAQAVRHGGGTAGFLHVLGAAPEGVLGGRALARGIPPIRLRSGRLSVRIAGRHARPHRARTRAFVRWNLRDGAQPRPIVTSIQSNAQETWREAAGRARLVAREVGETRDGDDVSVFASSLRRMPSSRRTPTGYVRRSGRCATSSTRRTSARKRSGESGHWRSFRWRVTTRFSRRRLPAQFVPEAVTAVTATQQQQPATQQQQQSPARG